MPPPPANASSSSTAATTSGTAAMPGADGGFGSLSNAPTGSLGSTLEGLRTLVHKRKTAWTYLKNAADGRTILLTGDDLRIAFPNEKMRNRSIRFTVLGMSLSSLLDILPAHDFLRGLLALVQEFEAIPEERFGGKHQQKGLFKVGSRSRKGTGSLSGSSSGGGVGGGGGDFGMAIAADGGDSSMLFMPNIPFELDYFQVLTTMCEILVEIYTRIGSYLGPSMSASSTTSLSATGLFPQPPMVARGAGSGALGLSPTLIDTVYKVDARLKKLISLLSKEIDTLARAAIKAELNSLGAAEYGLDA
ncbi:hypothetical protein C6P46_004390 [Rhodotorula mucilaginosa]|uniref:Uncharacterized protein n=1 Tax=Rhodotorula mucilaginosa TaxID=5537 RepID=A0A9P6W337_RHOMI|nr:hypothetical protein C6P46_004390 [Rhodotorula mucilaginosa]TKA56212.1 hypothetical protein B0A53_01502 [Rhodotorula sp. CCFEE 5036]